LQLFAEQRLDRIDREHTQLVARCDAREHGLDARLGEQVERHGAHAEALGAQADLLERFFSGDVARPDARREIRERAQQERRLADSRVAADQDDPARHEAAAEHSVELRQSGREPLDGPDVDAVEPRELDLAGVVRAFGALNRRQ
jgi:hypothetical protein